MERLTQWYDDGKIRGVLVKDGYEENSLQTIITKIDECYAAVALLKEYEDTGLTPEQIMKLKERDTAKAPEPAPLGMDGMVCPSCGNKALPWDRFCGECGQRFWEED